MFPFFDATMVLLIPALILSGYAQHKIRSAYARYSQVRSRRRFTGAQAAERVLYGAGIKDVTIEEIPGNLTDHFDPRKKTLRLSSGVYQSESLAAVGIAAHEAGHAVQHAQNYVPLSIRSLIVPVASFGTNGAWIMFILGLLAHAKPLMNLAIMLFSCGVVFYLITLPVEFNASSRAIRLLVHEGIIDQDEVPHTKKVLSAAALTYVAAALMAVMQLVRMLLLRNSRD